MEKKTLNTQWVVLLLLGVGLLVYALTARAGNLDPEYPPSPTMKTLDELSTQIAMSSPIKQVVRGRIMWQGSIDAITETLTTTVDPNKSVVLLSDVISFPVSSEPRNGTVLLSLEPTSITVQRDPIPVSTCYASYQIIEYK